MKKPALFPLVMIFMLLFTFQAALALFCPKCGQSNEDDFSYCIKCGASLQKARNMMQGQSAPAEDDDDAGMAEPTSGGIGLESPSKSNISRDDILGGEEKSLLNRADVRKVLEGNGAAGMDDASLQQLMNDPNMERVYEKYMDKGYQTKLLEGLRFINEDGGEDKGMDDSIKQLEGLFNMLNSSSGSDSGEESVDLDSLNIFE